MIRVFLLSFPLVCAFVSTPVFSITLEDFRALSSAEVRADRQEKVGSYSSAHPVHSESVGLGRKFIIDQVGGVGLSKFYLSDTGTTPKKISSKLHFKSHAGVRSKGIVIIDGSPNVSTVKYDGLGLDLFSRNGSKFVVKARASNSRIEALIKVYSNSEEFASTCKFRVDALNFQSFEIPFSKCLSSGEKGPANFSNVGALELVFNNNLLPGADVDVSYFGTDAAKLSTTEKFDYSEKEISIPWL